MLSDGHDLRDLTAQLGPPNFEQTANRGELPCVLVHWGCGCTAIGAAGRPEARELLRWTRCGHHALVEAAAFA